MDVVAWRRRVGALVGAFALLASACDGDGGGASAGRSPGRSPVASPTLEAGPVVGLVGTMSGPDSWRGTDAFEGADLALSQINRGREGTSVELVTLDDEGDIGRATEHIADLTSSDRTVAIVYAGPPAGLPPAHEALESAGVPAFILYGDLYSARLLDSHIFQMSPPMLWQARRMAAYLADDRRYEVVGLLAERTLEGNTALSSLQSAVRDRPGLRLVVRRYDVEEDLDRRLQGFFERRVEALVIQGSPSFTADVIDRLSEDEHRYRNTRQARFASLSRDAIRRQRRRSGIWRPQILAFDEAIAPRVGSSAPHGTVASDTYARGAHYLPVPSFEDFDSAFMNWWNDDPTGWELRAYEATRAIGWALERSGPDNETAIALESLRNRRFGGLPITFGPDDHTAVEQSTVGLWVIPRGSATVRERPRLPEGMPWVPLARGLSINGRRTDILPADWRYLFRNPPPPSAPAPRPQQMRFGVTTTRRDPVH